MELKCRRGPLVTLVLLRLLFMLGVRSLILLPGRTERQGKQLGGHGGDIFRHLHLLQSYTNGSIEA
jgi:hypothetical protein